jgi:hypothetical protein
MFAVISPHVARQHIQDVRGLENPIDNDRLFQHQEERVNCVGLDVLLQFFERFQHDIDAQLDEAFGPNPFGLERLIH